MSEKIESAIQEIGFELLDWLGDDLEDALVVGQCEEGMVSAEVIYRDPASGKLIYKYPSDQLEDLLYSLWEDWPEEQGKWRGFEYVLQKGEVELNVVYPENYDDKALSSEIRNRAVKKYFGNEPIDDSNPD